ncbi:MAG: rRNA maturation RNase YbeY [Chloroflexi bacterium]|jgi:probable rRNA maturation factor|nr:rRNA maturation RNase YbeY [Chloroflexota bacterium]
MSIYIEIGADTCLPGESQRIEAAAQATLAHQGISATSELSIIVTDDAQLHELNQQFRDVDAPTDVLSFPAEFSDPESGAAYLGDVLISYPRVVAQTQSGGHTPEAELQLLIVHGILHLLGHDHADEAEKNTMWAAQAEILATLGVEITPPA